MHPFRVLPAGEQLASHLKREIATGSLSGHMPGVHQLAASYGVHRRTAEEALRHLERQRILIPQGVGRRRLIACPDGGGDQRPVHLTILLGFPEDAQTNYIVDLQHRLTEAGHSISIARKSLHELGMSPTRVARLVSRDEADAYVVVAGPRGVLEWFAAQPFPSFALFGRRGGLPLAGIGPDKVQAIRAATRRLVELGHSRIALLARSGRRLPKPGASERAFLSELEKAGLVAGSYNLPEWGEDIDGLHECLDAMFRLTPPTALIVDEPSLFVAVQQHLARKGILAPEHVSLVCTDGGPHFLWLQPSVAHIRWDSRPWVHRVTRWAGNVSRGRRDLRQSSTKAEFVDGGTIGPAPTKPAIIH